MYNVLKFQNSVALFIFRFIIHSLSLLDHKKKDLFKKEKCVIEEGRYPDSKAPHYYFPGTLCQVCVQNVHDVQKTRGLFSAVHESIVWGCSGYELYQ